MHPIKFKGILIAPLILSTFLMSYSQKKIEHLQIDWPGEYNWKVANRNSDSSTQSVTIIPRSETVNNATIIGNMVAHYGVRNITLDQIIAHYQSSLDTGSKLTVLEKNENTKRQWVIFKVETSATNKYPDPESDLYYVIIGEYAMYENYVAIRKPSLNMDFIERWSGIFKSARLIIE